MRLIFVSSYNYPYRAAQYRHGLIMAKNYSRILKDNFLYLLFFVENRDYLRGINFKEVNKLRLPLQRLRLISLFYFFWLGCFLLIHPEWRRNKVVIITQESKIAAVLLFWRKIFKFSVIYECHGLHAPLTDIYVLKYSDYVIFVNKLTQEAAQKRVVKSIRSIFLPNAVNIELFQRTKVSRGNLRNLLGLPEDKILVGFIGRFIVLGIDKGVKNALLALKYLEDKYMMCFVGGREEEILHFKNIAREIGVDGRAIFVPYQEDQETVAKYMMAMNVLIYLPPPEKFFIEETSPMKLFEYMAAQKPIVVSNFPSMKEILDEQSAIFVDPLQPREIAKVIHQIINNCDFSDQLALNAYQKVLGNSWEKRASSIIDVARNLTREHL